MKRVIIIGCGQLGSRHLQSLKSIDQDIHITVIDPSAASLAVAKERFEGISGKAHTVEYLQEISSGDSFDLAIVPTSANTRADVIKKLLETNEVRYMILEKLLFDRKEQYEDIGALLNKRGISAWVNCSMRIMPLYKEVAKNLSGPVNYSVTGSTYGLVTNSIHYIDHMAHLNKCLDFNVDTNGLETKLYESKRKGFMELNGSLAIHFSNGGLGAISCYHDGNLPIKIDIASRDYRCISRESEGRAWISTSAGSWAWEDVAAPLPYQSQMTAWLVNDIFNKGSCGLATYEESSRIHLTLLDALSSFLIKNRLYSGDSYPFT